MDKKVRITNSEKPLKPLFTNLPLVLQDAVSCFEKEEDQKLILLGSICSLSSIYSNYFGIYDNQVLYPNLFMFVTAPAASGKGKLRFCRKLIEPVHNKLDNNSSNKVKSFILPANTSATGVYELLDNNDGKGIIFETEGDTLSQMFKQDFGNYSDGLRKAFHHEPINYYRRGNSEKVSIAEPKLSVLLTGTPNQILNLIPSVENGLASRFLYYNYSPAILWSDPFSESNGIGVQETFEKLGLKFLEEYEKETEVKQICFTDAQQKKFNDRFKELVDLFLNQFGEGFRAFVYRGAVSAFRICMVLTAARTSSFGIKREDKVIHVKDEDLDTALLLIANLLWDSGEVFINLSKTKIKSNFKSENELQLFDKLPNAFSKKDFIQIVESLGIKLKTSENYLDKFLELKLLIRISHGRYEKTT